MRAGCTAYAPALACGTRWLGLWKGPFWRARRGCRSDKVEFRVIVSHLDVESEGLGWFILVKGIEQCQNAVKEAAGIPGEFMPLVSFNQRSPSYHDLKN